MSRVAGTKPDSSGERDFRPMAIGSSELLADRSGALYWPDERTLLVADLHLEKGSAFAARGQMLPPYDTRTTLLRLAAVLTRWPIATVLALGDSFHDGEGAARMLPDDRRLLGTLQRRRSWIWLSGNHDPDPCRGLGGDVQVASRLQIRGIGLRHEPDPAAATPEICGHLHPAARLHWNGASVRGRCFAAHGGRIVMPAFGAFTGGLNVVSEPFAALFGGRPATVAMLGDRGIYPVPPSALAGD